MLYDWLFWATPPLYIPWAYGKQPWISPGRLATTIIIHLCLPLYTILRSEHAPSQ